MPALETTLREAEPLAEGLHTFFPELNPVLSYFNFHQQTIAGFITNAGADIAADYGTGQRGQAQMGIIEGRSFEAFKYGDKPPAWARGNAYLQPNSLGRALVLGGIESFKCPNGELKYAEDALQPGESHEDKLAPCFEAVPSLLGSAWKPGRLRMVKSGLKPSSSSRRGLRNMLRANRLCQAVSVSTRTPMRWAGSAPAQQSRTNRSRRWA